MRMLLKRLSNYAMLTAIGWLLVGCGPRLIPSGIVYCSEGNPESFNPQLVTSGTTVDATSQQIYNRLVNYDAKSGQIIPSLATLWYISDNELTYTFTLRKGVSFHQSKDFTPTRQFNADDVLFSFNRIIDIDHPYHQVSKTGYPFFQSIGFNLHDTMIFRKQNPIPQIYRKRYSNEFEYMFVFSKGRVKTHNPIETPYIPKSEF